MTRSENWFKNKAGHQKQYDGISYKQRRQSRHCGPEEMQEKITKAKRNLKLKTLKTRTWTIVGHCVAISTGSGLTMGAY